MPPIARTFPRHKQATAIDLAGRNVLEAVKTSVLPKVIDCPDGTRGRFTADGVAKDGIQLR
ncbi:MAG: flotillin-like FloA family protein [Planctomycetota bacterium]